MYEKYADKFSAEDYAGDDKEERLDDTMSDNNKKMASDLVAHAAFTCFSATIG